MEMIVPIAASVSLFLIFSLHDYIWYFYIDFYESLFFSIGPFAIYFLIEEKYRGDTNIYNKFRDVAFKSFVLLILGPLYTMTVMLVSISIFFVFSIFFTLPAWDKSNNHYLWFLLATTHFVPHGVIYAKKKLARR